MSDVDQLAAGIGLQIAFAKQHPEKVSEKSSCDALLAAIFSVGWSPRLSRLDRGWYAVAARGGGSGVTAEARSEFDHRSPNDALWTCLSRILEAAS